MNPLLVFYLVLCLIAATTLASSSNTLRGLANGSNSVTFDGRSFLINNERILFIAGSVHYPRLSQYEWGKVFKLLKDSGINLIQTYVFWDIHEPSQGNYFFPNDESSSNLVKFIQVAQEYGMYVNLRIGPYVCAEWNYGGLPVWLKKVYQPGTTETIVYRTDNEEWLNSMLAFSDRIIDLMSENHLFFGGEDSGPIVMLQLENEYGNIQAAYGKPGVTYIDKLAKYIDEKKETTKNLPWIMCQQGEGTGTNPPAHIINTCNGYYCDNWIPLHAKEFPNQPHMFTENWPGWFQNWGDAVPHRPAVDVAFSVARWFARGGSYMNYYMAFGGTTYGRHVGGPNIITSYDYDVQVNEYAMPNEPKYSLLSGLHQTLLAHSAVLLSQPVPETVTSGADYCESHTYQNDEDCLVFLSNWDTVRSCSFPVNEGKVTIDVSPWSVSILSGRSCSAVNHIFSTRENAKSIKANTLVPLELTTVSLEKGFCESVPPAGVDTVASEFPQEQLTVTGDASDYLWYSTSVPAVAGQEDRNATLSFSLATGGGGMVYLFVNGQRTASYDTLHRLKTQPQQVGSAVSDRVSFDVTLSSQQSNQLTILTTTMGLQNYGAHLEEVTAGIVSNVTLDGLVLSSWTHSIGLAGERQQLFNGLKDWKAAAGRSSYCNSVRWFQGVYSTDDLLSSAKAARGVKNSQTAAAPEDYAFSLNMITGGLSKGAVWVNGFMLGRYWDIVASGTCAACASESYTGAYGAERCRTGCGSASQTYYKLPSDVLFPAGSDRQNVVVVADESGLTDGVESVSVSLNLMYLSEEP
jgi:hypothetical protein